MPQNVVSLPMYAAPADALAAFWYGLRGHMLREGLAPVPEGLCIPSDLDAHWRARELLLSQTCGFPLATTLREKVRYVGTPCYRAPGCKGPLYSSALVVRAGDAARALEELRGRRAAFNSRDSQSGYNALRALVAPLAVKGRFFGAVLETGAHRASAAAVERGAADIAAIDAVTLALLERDNPTLTSNLRLLAFTPAVPGLPLITSLNTSDADLSRLRAALAASCADPVLATARAALLLDGFEVLAASAYEPLAAMRDAATARGYPDLA